MGLLQGLAGLGERGSGESSRLSRGGKERGRVRCCYGRVVNGGCSHGWRGGGVGRGGVGRVCLGRNRFLGSTGMVFAHCGGSGLRNRGFNNDGNVRRCNH